MNNRVKIGIFKEFFKKRTYISSFLPNMMVCYYILYNMIIDGKDLTLEA
jgi:hypothetical protein